MLSRHEKFSGFHFFIWILKVCKKEILSEPWHNALLEVWWTESYFLGLSVASSFVQKVLLELKEIGHSLFCTFQLQGLDDFDCKQKQSHLFPTAFQTMNVSWHILFASNVRVIYFFPLLAQLWQIHARGK